jgi:hypothetical protein
MRFMKMVRPTLTSIQNRHPDEHPPLLPPSRGSRSPSSYPGLRRMPVLELHGSPPVRAAHHQHVSRSYRHTPFAEIGPQTHLGPVCHDVTHL